MKARLAAVLCSVLLFSVAVFADNKDILTVKADAVVKAQPEKVVMEIGISTRGTDLLDTKKKNAEIVKKVVDYCVKNNITEQNIKSDFIRIQPIYKNYYEDKNPIYMVEQNLSITLLDVSKQDIVLTDLLGLGVNQVRSLDFQVNDMAKYRSEARKLAVGAAKKKAEELAAEAGIKLGKVNSISEDNIITSPLLRGAANMYQASAFAPGSDTNTISTITVTSSVVISYNIK